MSELLIAFYGDDFTGSTDAMECLELNGIPAVLFLDPPTLEQVRRFPDVRGVGVAGISRTLSPEQMSGELIPKFEALRSLGAPFVHYKICSTFDSSPTMGSVGRAIDIGWEVLHPSMVPMMVGAPFLRRYVVFGNLFARVGETTYRLDRHPTMSKHPVTPMPEADLRLHLAEQTTRPSGLVDLWHMDSRSDEELDAQIQNLRDSGVQIVFFDTLTDRHMLQIGRIVWSLRGEHPVFLVGSSGFEYALGMYLQSIDLLQKPAPLVSPGRADQLLVMSGSCAPPTAEQIHFVLQRGFHGVRLNAPDLVDAATQADARAEAVEAAVNLLTEENSVVLYSALGPEDPAIAQTRTRLEALGQNPDASGHRLGTQQGLVVREILERRPSLRRVVVCGGDTCGYASRQLGIYALRIVLPVMPGAPLCRACSEQTRFDGLQIVLKGGQNGSADYLARVFYGLQAHESVPTI
jgi:3-oxoisoapionate kinase